MKSALIEDYIDNDLSVFHMASMGEPLSLVDESIDDFNTKPVPSLAIEDLAKSKSEYINSSEYLRMHASTQDKLMKPIEEVEKHEDVKLPLIEKESLNLKKADDNVPAQSNALNVHGLCDYLDLHSRISTGSYHMMLALDRLACPIPEYKNVHITRMFDTCKDFPRWSSSLSQQMRKDTLAVLTEHIKKTSQYLQKNK